MLYCASRTDSYHTEVLHHNSYLSREQFSNQAILFLPAVNDSILDSSGVLSANSQADLMQTLRSDMTICSWSSFERRFLEVFPPRVLTGFYDNIVGNDILALQNSDSLWLHMKCRYLLTLRVVYGARVRTFEGALMRRVRVETELWDTQRQEIVWRAQTVGKEGDARTTDSRFLKDVILHLFAHLPEYKPSLNETVW